jgi:hypothetical protein
MPTYTVTDPQTKKVVKLTGDSPPTEADLTEIFGKLNSAPAAAPAAAPAPTAPAKPMTMLGRPVKPEVAAQIESMVSQDRTRTNQGWSDVKGLMKSALGTVEGGGKLIRSIPGVGPMLSRGPEVQVPFTSQPTPEEAGAKTVGDVAQFFLPAAGVAKVKNALTTGVRVLDALVGATLEGSSAAGVQAMQQGDTKGTGTTAVVTGATHGLVEGGLKAAGWLGERIEHALVKPSIADERGGFLTRNIFKYDLGGTLSQSYDKTQKKLTELSSRLQDALKSHPLGQRAPQVDILQALADTSSDLVKQSARNFGSNKAIEGAVSKLLDDPLFQGAASTGKVDLATANQIKQAVGELGAWLHDPSGRVIFDPDSKAMETVANTLYAKLKTVIEHNALGPVAAINKQLSEVIPIRVALIRRIPVEARQNVMNLGDIVGLSTGQWGISLANRVLKSGRAANAAVKLGDAAPTVAGRVVAPAMGGAMSQMVESR